MNKKEKEIEIQEKVFTIKLKDALVKGTTTIEANKDCELKIKKVGKEKYSDLEHKGEVTKRLKAEIKQGDKTIPEVDVTVVYDNGYFYDTFDLKKVESANIDGSHSIGVGADFLFMNLYGWIFSVLVLVVVGGVIWYWWKGSKQEEEEEV